MYFFCVTTLKKQAKKRSASSMQIFDVLRNGKGIDGPTQDKHGDWRIKMKHYTCGRIVQAVVVFKDKNLIGEGIVLYSNIGFDIASWMLEIAYNVDKGHAMPEISFSQIMKDELFTKVFNLSDKTRISPGPSGDGDVIQAGCGDMVSSVSDLLTVAKALQKGEEHLSSYFGEGWQKMMLDPRGSDGTYTYGLGCEANASSIQFNGLNFEIFEDGTERDVTAHIAFPLRENQPGIVAMSDSNALGPEPNQVKFRQELRKLAGLPTT